MKKLYAYLDYRLFLKDFYLETKKQEAVFSYQKFSLQAGIKSPNYLKLIIDGKRDLTVSNIHQFAKALKLTEVETEFFETLVLFNQSTASAETKYYKSKLLKLKSVRVPKQTKVKLKNISQLPYLPAIVVSCLGLCEEMAAQQLALRFKLPLDQVQKMLEKLIAENVIESQLGQLKLTHDYYIQYDKLRSNEDQKSFLSAQLELSKRALLERYASDAQFFAHTFTTKSDRLPGIIKKIAEMIEEVTNESNNDPAENVMQLNIQFFPLDQDTAGS